jgi:hypothetical protein
VFGVATPIRMLVINILSNRITQPTLPATRAVNFAPTGPHNLVEFGVFRWRNNRAPSSSRARTHGRDRTADRPTRAAGSHME